jgi:enediyne biosynthesis protein E4
MKNPADAPDPISPEGRDLSIKFTVIFGLLAFIPLVLMWHFLSVKKSDAPDAGPKANGDAPTPPAVKFKNVTAEAGITFARESGARGEKLLPETMGSGCAFFDFDNDGDQDVFLVNSMSWPHNSPTIAPTPSALYENLGQGKFKNVTAGSGFEAPLYGMGVALGDYDNDGRADVFITAVGGNRLFHNEAKGKFSDRTKEADVEGGAWSTSAAFFDYDNDGDLDLFVCNYVKWSREIDLQADYQLAGVGRAYGPPMNFSGAFPYLYRNEGNGKFTEVSAQAGLQIVNKATGLPMAKSLGVAPNDLDNDGWMDLIVANDTVQNFVFHNEKNGTFREVGATSGLAFDPYGSARGAMGIDTGRFQDENTLGVSIGNFANEMTALYVQQDKMLFSDQAQAQGIGAASRTLLTFGVFFFDYDLDGWLDLLTVNGHIEPEISKISPLQSYAQPAQLFWNARGASKKGGFVLVTPERAGADLFEPVVARGSAFADIDGDGDSDVLITQANGPARLLRNDRPADNNWARLKLVGRKSNRDAIGAIVKARMGSHTVTRQVMATRGYLSQSELPVTIGLGRATSIDEAVIIWPSGTKQTLKNVAPGKLTTVEEPEN